MFSSTVGGFFNRLDNTVGGAAWRDVISHFKDAYSDVLEMSIDTVDEKTKQLFRQFESLMNNTSQSMESISARLHFLVKELPFVEKSPSVFGALSQWIEPEKEITFVVKGYFPNVGNKSDERPTLDLVDQSLLPVSFSLTELKFTIPKISAQLIQGKLTVPWLKKTGFVLQQIEKAQKAFDVCFKVLPKTPGTLCLEKIDHTYKTKRFESDVYELSSRHKRLSSITKPVKGWEVVPETCEIEVLENNVKMGPLNDHLHENCIWVSLHTSIEKYSKEGVTVDFQWKWSFFLGYILENAFRFDVKYRVEFDMRKKVHETTSKEIPLSWGWSKDINVSNCDSWKIKFTDMENKSYECESDFNSKYIQIERINDSRIRIRAKKAEEIPFS